MLVHPSGLSLSSSALRHLSELLTARRAERGTRWRRLPVGRQALLVGRQALLVLVHLRCGHTYAQLAAGLGVSTATVYRYVAEAVEVPTARTPGLPSAARTAAGKAYLVLDGTLLPIDWGHLPAEGGGRSPPTGPTTPGSTAGTG